MSESDPIVHILELKGQMGALQQAFATAERERHDGRSDQQEIKDSLCILAARMGAVPDTDHKEHHEFIRAFIEEHKQRQEVRAAIIQRIATGGAWAFISGLAGLVWYAVKSKLGLGD